jgi:general secretion pathway protein G
MRYNKCMKRNHSITNRRGFTLVELLVVIVIIGMLVGLVGPKIFKKITGAKITTAQAQISLLGQALDQFRLDTGRYPTTQEGLNALMANPGIEGWDGPYLKKAIPADPWKRPYNFQSPGSHGEYDIFTYGLDGTPGGDGENTDVTSWE